MWPWSGAMSEEEEGQDAGKARLHELVHVQLMQEVEHGAPGARLSARLRTALERMSPAERRAVAARTAGGCAPLFVAARRGNAEVVEYLVHVCGAPLEQRGAYRPPAERAAHSVTPLWAAAVGGRLRALRVLADAGAALDARSDSGSTPLRSACFMTHLEAVRFLCERGADVHARNHNGGTCLINGVQCARLTRYLLARGARVDARDAHGKTALHYAIQEHRVDTARVLLAGGASPHVRSAAGDDALRTACVRGAAHVAELLCSTVRYSPEQVADAHELLGATQLDEFNDAAAALASWRHATDIRYSGTEYIRKRPALALALPPDASAAPALPPDANAAPALPPDASAVPALPADASAALALGGAREWRSLAELDELAGDSDAARVQALLVAVRVLGLHHKDTVFRIMYRGAWYADAGRFRRCLDLWTWALEIRIAKDTLLHADTCHTLCALTRLLADLSAEHDVVMRVLRLVAGALPDGQRLVRVRPACAAQAESWDRALRCLVHLAAAADGAASPAQRRRLVAALAATVALAPETQSGGESPLHLACSRLTAVRSAYFAEEARPAALFPHARTARLLLAAGARAQARDRAGRTPLHVAATPYNCSEELLERVFRTVNRQWRVPVTVTERQYRRRCCWRAARTRARRTRAALRRWSWRRRRTAACWRAASRWRASRRARCSARRRPACACACCRARCCPSSTCTAVATDRTVLPEGGAHACSPDARGAAPLELAPAAHRGVLARRVTLACLAARALLGAPPARLRLRLLPRTLLPFLDLHRCCD